MSKISQEKFTKGGEIVLRFLDEGKSKGKELRASDAYDLLESKGYSEDEVLEVVNGVIAFLKHIKNDHSMCHDGCERADRKCDDDSCKCNEKKHDRPKEICTYTDDELEDMK